MLIKKFIRLLGEKFNLIGKIAFLLLLSSIIFISISATIFNVQLKEFKTEVYEINVPKHVNTLIKDSLFSQENAKKGIKAAEKDFKRIILNHKDSIIASLAYFIILSLAFIMVIQTIKYILTFAIKEFMNVGANLKLSNIYVSNFVTILSYSIVLSLINIILAIIDIFIVYGIFKVMIEFSAIVSLLLIGIIFAILIAFNNIFLGEVETMMIVNKKGVFIALKDSFMFGIKNFKNMGAHIYLLTFFAILFFNAFGIFTFGIGYLISGIIVLIAFRVMLLIEYYEVNNLPYYIAKDTIYYNRNKINKI